MENQVVGNPTKVARVAALDGTKKLVLRKSIVTNRLCVRANTTCLWRSLMNPLFNMRDRNYPWSLDHAVNR